MNFSEPISLNDAVLLKPSDNIDSTNANHLVIGSKQLIQQMLQGKVKNLENIDGAFTHILLEDSSIQETLLTASVSKSVWFTYIARCAYEILVDAKPTPVNGEIFTEFSYSYRGEKWGAAGGAIGGILSGLHLKSCLDFVSRTFPPQANKQKGYQGSAKRPFESYSNSINNFLFSFQSAFNQVARFHYMQVYKKDLPPAIMACISQSPSLNPENLPKNYLQNEVYPDAVFLFQGMIELFKEFPQSPKSLAMLECVSAIAIWSQCYDLSKWAISTGGIEKINLKYSDVLILHTGLIALEKAVAHMNTLRRTASQHRFDLLQLLGYPKGEFDTLAPLKEPPIDAMTVGFKFEDRRILFEIIALARVRFYDSGNVRDSLLSYLRSNPEKLLVALEIVKNRYLGKILTNAQIIALLDQNIPTRKLGSLMIREGVVSNMEILLVPAPINPRLVLIKPNKTLSPKGAEHTISKSPLEIQKARLTDLASKCDLVLESINTDELLDPELITKVFTLTKRGLLWRSAHPELAAIFREIWITGTLKRLESFIEKRTQRKRVSKMVLSHNADKVIQNILLSGCQEEINRMSIKISTDLGLIIAHLDPKDLSSTSNGRSEVGSGGFAKVIRAILFTCKQELEESNSTFLERSLSFNWKKIDGHLLRGSVQSNKSNLGIIPNLPESFGLYAGIVALGENAATMNIGGHGKGTTVGATVKKALRAIHCED